MPVYKLASGQVLIQLFPGERLQTSIGGTTLHTLSWDVPEDYYSHPETHGFSNESSKWGFTEERRGSLALYDYPR